MTDLELLRQYEPIVVTPTARCSFRLRPMNLSNGPVLVNGPGGYVRELVPEGELNPDKLAEYDEAPPNHTLYLRLVSQPLTGTAYQHWLARPDRVNFSAAGRWRVRPYGRESWIAAGHFPARVWLGAGRFHCCGAGQVCRRREGGPVPSFIMGVWCERAAGLFSSTCSSSI